jgi:SAM-dependent methyltransferase
VIHRDRRRALSFGEDAAQYDRARPTYPAALVDDLMRGAPTRVLDVGCGTGIAIGASGLFEAAEVHNYAWELPYTTAEWLDKLPTHSDHRVLPPEQLAVLLDAVGAAVDGLGGSITVRYATRLVTARRLTDETR